MGHHAPAEKAVRGFATCGLWPCDRNIFSDEDFAASLVTDEPEIVDRPEINQHLSTEPIPCCSQPESQMVPCSQSDGSASADNHLKVLSATLDSVDIHPSIPTTRPNIENQPSSSKSTASLLIQSISPLPKSVQKRKRSRKVEHSAIITNSPYKKMVEEKIEKSKSKGNSRSNVTKGKRPAKTSLKFSKKKTSKIDEVSDDEEWPCIICGEPFSNSRSREPWLQCTECKKWAHEACTTGSVYFICPNCESDVSEISE